MNKARVILVDDYEPSFRMYRDLLQSEVDVIATACDGKTAISAAEENEPDLMILDIEMGAISGLSVARWLREHRPAVKIVFVTMHAEPAYIKEAEKIGAQGYVLKKNAVPELLNAVRTVLAGGFSFHQISKEHRI